jgi:hypothetical protein
MRPENCKSKWSAPGPVVLATLLGLVLVGAPQPAGAQPVEPTWGGDIWSRPRLTGDWFGLRDAMGTRGVVFDLDFLQILQGTGTGGRDTGVSYGGVAEYQPATIWARRSTMACWWAPRAA